MGSASFCVLVPEAGGAFSSWDSLVELAAGPSKDSFMVHELIRSK